jgi:hypothetical protein
MSFRHPKPLNCTLQRASKRIDGRARLQRRGMRPITTRSGVIQRLAKRYLLELRTMPLRQSSVAGTPCSASIERISTRLLDLRFKKNQVTLSSDQGERNFDVVIWLSAVARSTIWRARFLQAVVSTVPCGSMPIRRQRSPDSTRRAMAGDVVRGLNQVVATAAESAVAATDIHNKLRGA